MRNKEEEDFQTEIMNLAAQYAQKIEAFSHENDMDSRALMLACSLLSCGLMQSFGMGVQTYLETQKGLWDVAKELSKEQKSEEDEEELDDALTTAEDMCREYFMNHPEELKMLTDDAKKRGDNILFSPEIQKRMEPFSQMSIEDALKSEDYWKAIFTHCGCSQEEFEEIKRKVKTSS